MTAQDRKHFLSELDDFISSKSQALQNFYKDIGWNLRTDLSSCNKTETALATCPLDAGHTVRHNKLDEHVFHCKWKKAGYSEEDVPFPENFDGGGSSVTLSPGQLETIIQDTASLNCNVTSVPVSTSVQEVPQSASRYVSSFSSHERLALYEYVIQKTSTQSMPSMPLSELDLAFQTSKPKTEEPKSFLEILAEQRNSKRRRLNYRQAKHVHTKHKSQSEVTREVIENQMELYKEWLQQQNEEFEDNTRNEDCSNLNETSNLKEFDSPYSKKKEDTNIYDKEIKTSSKHKKEKYERSKYRSSSSSRYRDGSEHHTKDRDEDRRKYAKNNTEHNRSEQCNRYEQEIWKGHDGVYNSEKHRERKERHSNKKRRRSHSSDRHKHSKKSKHKDRY